MKALFPPKFPEVKLLFSLLFMTSFMGRRDYGDLLLAWQWPLRGLAAFFFSTAFTRWPDLFPLFFAVFLFLEDPD